MKNQRIKECKNQLILKQRKENKTKRGIKLGENKEKERIPTNRGKIRQEERQEIRRIEKE
jgi:hypothetical protein